MTRRQRDKAKTWQGDNMTRQQHDKRQHDKATRWQGDKVTNQKKFALRIQSGVPTQYLKRLLLGLKTVSDCVAITA